MKTKASIFLVALLSGCSFLVNAQAPVDSSAAYNFVYRSWNNQSGLPQNTVYDMAQDSAGYLWGATEEGLFRFDGAAFTVVNESNTPGLLSNTFYDLLTDGGNIWASGRNAILRIRSKVEQVWDLSHQVSGGWIKCIEKDPAGNLWIGTSNGRLYYLNKDSVYACPQWKGGMAGPIEALRYTAQGMVIGTARGLYTMQETEAQPKAMAAFAGVAINALEAGSGGELWIGSARGLFRLGADTLHYTPEQGLKENFVQSLYYDKTGRLWIGFRSAGYQLLYNGKLNIPEQTRYAHDGIRSILATNEQFIWMGTNSSGLLQLKPSLIGRPPAGAQLAGKIILAVYQHSNGDKWIGTAGRGVHRWTDNQLTSFTQDNGLSNNLVLSLCGRDDLLYIGTSNGMDRFNTVTKRLDKHFTTANGLQNNAILALFNDSKNRIWITTRQGGLHTMNKDERIEPFKLPAVMDNSNLLCVFEDSRHQIWLGSRGAGMLRIDENDQAFSYGQKEGFPADIVYAFFEDTEGDLWMATEKGLVVNSMGKYKLFNRQAGLFFNETYRLLRDAAGYVWLSGNLGLQRIALKELLAAKHATDTTRRMAVRLFNAYDGMPNSETNGGFFPAGWPMQDGTIWFPTAQGVAIADHRLVSEESSVLHAQIQSLRYGNNEYFPNEKVKLPPGVYNFEIQYTSIDFSKASDIQFYFRLRGLNNEWTPAGNRHSAYFSALEPGNYTFEVKAERYGYWSEVDTMEFSVEPYFYQTTGFKVLMGSLIVLVVAGVIWSLRRAAARKIRQQQRVIRAQINGQEKERQFISTELHDSVNQQLGTAKLYLDFAKTNEKLRPELIAKSEAAVNSVITEIRALCNALTPPGLKDIGLKEALEDLVNSYSSVKKFEVHWNFAIDAGQLEEDLQFTLFRITQEQMNNIARHSDAANVWVDFVSVNGAINVTLRDDGRGFDAKTKKYGMGFDNIQNRLLLYQGKMEIKTAPGKGCTLLLHIPLQKGKEHRS